jgi:hypothetical protein
MKRFIQRFSDRVIGHLSGFDRVLLRGSLPGLSTNSRMRDFLYQNGVLLKDFVSYSKRITAQLKEISQTIAKRKGRPFIYLPSSQTNKEEIALRVLKEQPTDRGLICMLSCVEPCWTYQVVAYRETKKIQMRTNHRMSLRKGAKF